MYAPIKAAENQGMAEITPNIQVSLVLGSAIFTVKPKSLGQPRFPFAA